MNRKEPGSNPTTKGERYRTCFLASGRLVERGRPSKEAIGRRHPKKVNGDGRGWLQEGVNCHNLT